MEGCRSRTPTRSCPVWLSVLLGVDAELLHSREEGGAIDSHACCCSVAPANATLAFDKDALDLLTLSLGLLIAEILAVESIDGFLHNPGNIILTLVDRRTR